MRRGAALVTNGSGVPARSDARQRAQGRGDRGDRWLEHVLKGGPVMWPILGPGGAALLVVLVKWAVIDALRARPSRSRKSTRCSRPSAQRDNEARRGAGGDRVGGPIGRMLEAGAQHLGEPRELIEEVMYETVLATKLRLNAWLPFVAICASSAPLLGLLGTVTGIMNTFTLMTVFGTGDVKTLSSGISEALITTEYGLIVAIPSLLLHAFLSREGARHPDEMEKARGREDFVNQLAKTPHRRCRGRELGTRCWTAPQRRC
jgi:biopolymer transport protein ExbB